MDAPKILIVDDQPRNLDVLEAMLEGMNCAFVRATTADDALLALVRHDFAALVLDIKMPGMSGLELATLIKQRKRSQHVPILFLTAHSANDEDVLRGYNVGAVDYLSKPVNADILRSKIGVFVELFRKTHALAEANERLQREIAARELAQAELKLANSDLERRVQERTAKLQETIQSLDGFCYSIAHDLRAPLRALGGFSNELFKDYNEKLDEAGKDYLRRIRAAAARMDQLILDLLRFGRLNTAELPAQIVKLEDIVRIALAPLEDEIKSKSAHVNVQSPLLSVRANSVMVEQAVGNLIANALKFVPKTIEPRVDIWTEQRDGMVRLSIRDNGIGIKPDHVKKLFQPFVRLVNGSDYPGTGIGLAIVRKGVERMGGQVGLASKPKEGSCFWIDLPNA